MEKILVPEKIDIKSHPEKITEKMIQEIIADNPAIIGLGDLDLKDKERPQPRAGRLDLLMQDPETNRRYEIEIQLGKTDESHIIRTIEYYDIERKRYPQYEHCAVIIAEDITSRFLNVIGLFNRSLPLIAIQMNAFKFEDKIGLVFTKVLDEMPLGLVDADEEIQAATNRDYWLNRGSEATVKMADEFLGIVNSFKSGFALKYNKEYIGLAKNGQANNFALCRPRKIHMILELKLPKSKETDEIIENAGIVMAAYDNQFKNYRINLYKGDVKKHAEVLKDLLIKAEVNLNG